jgi:hypothetical protein
MKGAGIFVADDLQIALLAQFEPGLLQSSFAFDILEKSFWLKKFGFKQMRRKRFHPAKRFGMRIDQMREIGRSGPRNAETQELLIS